MGQQLYVLVHSHCDNAHPMVVVGSSEYYWTDGQNDRTIETCIRHASSQTCAHQFLDPWFVTWRRSAYLLWHQCMDCPIQPGHPCSHYYLACTWRIECGADPRRPGGHSVCRQTGWSADSFHGLWGALPGSSG